MGEERYEDATTILHSLRGSLGVIGATKFSESALNLEMLIHDKASITVLSEALNCLEIDFISTLAAAELWVLDHKIL